MSNVIVEMASSSASRYLKGGILLDDRVEMSAGKRIHDANRLGIPFILVIANETERSLATQVKTVENSIFSAKKKRKFHEKTGENRRKFENFSKKFKFSAARLLQMRSNDNFHIGAHLQPKKTQF